MEAGAYLPYRDVLSEVTRRIARDLGTELRAADEGILGGSVKDWPAFSETPASLTALKKRFRLAVLSNVDDDMFNSPGGSRERLGVALDEFVSAQQVRSYKPAPAHFLTALDRIGLPPSRVLHVAQSLYHDHVPAKRLGLRTVWVNRRRGKAGPGATPPAEATPDLEIPDLATLAELAAER